MLELRRGPMHDNYSQAILGIVTYNDDFLGRIVVCQQYIGEKDSFELLEGPLAFDRPIPAVCLLQ